MEDGRVFVVGGGRLFKYTDPVFVPELFDPATETWSLMAPHQAGRMYHSTALLLPDGRVLCAGQDSGSLQKFGEIFSPPYLFRGARPTVTGTTPAVAGYGQSLLVETPDAAVIAKVTLIRHGSVTHAFDAAQRLVPLSFTQAAGGLSITLPVSPNVAPPGPYMLFLVNGNGVPSVARIMRLQ